MAAARLRHRQGLDIWPGFVDALATLLIIIIFTLMIFVVAQFYMTDALSGRDRALTRLGREIERLSEMLALEKSESVNLRKSLAEISAELQATLSARDEARDKASGLQATIGELEAQAAGFRLEVERLSKEAEDLRKSRQQLSERASAATATAEEKSAALTEAQSALELLNRQVAALREQLASLQEALDASEAKTKGQRVEIETLTKRLNIAMAAKVKTLEKYRSEFFGRLREVLGARSDIQIVGDRFVFQSEVLFESSSAELEEQGQAQIARLARALKDISSKVPKDINWILRVDGHTDKRPIRTGVYPSNWELSNARALSVVKFLITQGIPPHRLAATGFGEFQPIDRAETAQAFRRNRRIELKFDQR